MAPPTPQIQDLQIPEPEDLRRQSSQRCFHQAQNPQSRSQGRQVRQHQPVPGGAAVVREGAAREQGEGNVLQFGVQQADKDRVQRLADLVPQNWSVVHLHISAQVLAEPCSSKLE
jgi:hypothetical protein